jgi:hypothetical protein
MPANAGNRIRARLVYQTRQAKVRPHESLGEVSSTARQVRRSLGERCLGVVGSGPEKDAQMTATKWQQWAAQQVSQCLRCLIPRAGCGVYGCSIMELWSCRCCAINNTCAVVPFT